MEQMDYKVFYEQLTGRIRKSGAACFILRTAGKAATLVMYGAYPLLLLRYLHLREYGELLRALLVPGISFALLSLVRAQINRPRPYETWNIRPLIHKDTKGCSMPSRHVFSSAVIAMAWLRAFPPAGGVLLLVGAATALIRVLGGVHYPSDVLAGYLAGVLAGMLMLL